MQRPGGRTNRTREAIVTAAFEVVAEHGYDGLTVDALAEHSGVHKTTIYRRWESIDDVLFDAVIARSEREIPLDQSDDPMADLVAMGVSVAANLADPIASAAAAATLSNPKNRRLVEFSSRFWEIRIEAASRLVVRAQHEGAVDPDLDPESVVERIVGPIWFRTIVLRKPVEQPFVELLVYSVA